MFVENYNLEKTNKCIDIIYKLDTKNIIEVGDEIEVIKNKVYGVGFELNNIVRVIIYTNNILEIELVDDYLEEDNDYSNELECLLNKNINKVIDILSFIRDNKEILIKRVLDLVLEK